MGAYGTPEHLPGDNEETEYQYGYNQPYKTGSAHTALRSWQKILLVIYSCIAAVFGLVMLVSVSLWQGNKALGVIFIVIYIFSSIFFYRRVKLRKIAWPFILCSAISLFVFLGCVPINQSNAGGTIPAAVSNSKTNVAASQKNNIPIETAEQYKKQCSAYKYKEIARNPNNYNGKLAKFTGQVMQIEDDGAGSEFILLNVTKDEYDTWSDSIYVEYSPKSADESRILEDDIITVYGQLSGIKSYTAVLGNEISVPYFKAQYAKILPESNSSK